MSNFEQKLNFYMKICKSYYLVDVFQNQTWHHFDFEKNWLKNYQIFIEVTLRLKLVVCMFF